MNKKWFLKNDGLRKQYYPLYVSKNKFEVFNNKYIAPSDLKDLLTSKPRYSIYHYQIPGFAILTQTVPNQTDDGVELPAGAYSYISSDHSSDARLEVRAHRKGESYLGINNTVEITKDIAIFRNNKAVYEELGVSYRRGYLVYGPPGNGKTAMIRNMLNSEEFKDTQIIWCKTLPEDDFLERLDKTPMLKILILEELSSSNGDSNYNMSKLLEMLDGESSLSNCIVIATTNYPELLAKNLADRPSRFDMTVEVANPSANDVTSLLEFFLKRSLAEGEISIKDVSVAHIKEIVILHKTHGVTLEEAARRVLKQSQGFKDNFQEKKDFGL